MEVKIRYLIWLLCLCALVSEYFAGNCGKDRKCKTSRIRSLKASDCYRMDLKEVPNCLPTDIEVLELSYNRIRKLSNQDLQKYPYIAYLYLTDNLIVNLDDDTFKDLTSLQTLDLSINALAKVPPAIFQLPSLKSLYLSQNMNINVAESIKEAQPLAHSSLTKLDISYITEDGYSTDFPDFGQLPMLAFLNITGDQFNYISTRHFAGLCNLQILANANVTAFFENDCDCWKINQWLSERKVTFTAFLCPTNAKDCDGEPIDEDDLQIFSDCREKFQKIERFKLLSKVGLWVGVAAAIILLLVALFFYRRWSRFRQRKRRADAQMKREMDQFLNSQSKS